MQIRLDYKSVQSEILRGHTMSAGQEENKRDPFFTVASLDTEETILEVLHSTRQKSTAQPSCATPVLTPRTPSHTSQTFAPQCVALPYTWFWELKRKELFPAEVCRNEWTGQHRSKQMKFISERQISHFSHLWFIDFHVNPENHLCTYDVRTGTNFLRKRESK